MSTHEATKATKATCLSDAQYEHMTLDYWRAREEDCDSVSIAVRKRGRIVRYLRLDADGTVTPLAASSLPVPPDE
jgi:hypothetical protein